MLDPQSINSYGYARRNPINNIDPDGRLWVSVNGTYFGGTNKDWSGPSSQIANSIRNDTKFSGQDIVYYNWGGADNANARSNAVIGLQKFINSEMSKRPDEDLNIMTHSHGGQVVAAYTNLDDSYNIKNLLTIETPNIGNKFNYDKVENHVQTYSKYDLVQKFGGKQYNMTDAVASSVYTKVPSIGILGVYSLNWGQFGIAGRTFDGAKNVDISSEHTSLLKNPLSGISNHFITNSGTTKIYDSFIKDNLK